MSDDKSSQLEYIVPDEKVLSKKKTRKKETMINPIEE